MPKILITIFIILFLISVFVFFSKEAVAPAPSETQEEATEEPTEDVSDVAEDAPPPIVPEEKTTSDVTIEKVELEKRGEAWNVYVTLLHPDSGWDHYADMWRIVDENGNIIATRVLAHPHVGEQPFTRGLSGVDIPLRHSVLYLEARDTVHGLTERIRIDFVENIDDRIIIRRL